MMISSAASTTSPLSGINAIESNNNRIMNDESDSNDDSNNKLGKNGSNNNSLNNILTNNDEDPMSDFRLLTDKLVYGEVPKPLTSSLSSSIRRMKKKKNKFLRSKKKYNNILEEEEEEEIGVEVLPFKDITRVRVELQSAFQGIPMPAVISRSNSQRGRSRSIGTKKTKIDSSHPQYELAVGMMLGIREAVSGMDGLMQEAEWADEDFCTIDQLNKECRRNRKYTFFGKEHRHHNQYNTTNNDDDNNATTKNNNNDSAADIMNTNAAAAPKVNENNNNSNIHSNSNNENLTIAQSSTPTVNDNDGCCTRTSTTTTTKPKPKQGEINFKAYAPLVFARLRAHLDKNLFLHSVCGNFRYLEFLSNAKSGSFFFFSHDRKYLIKTLTMSETHFLVHDLLPTYYHYIQQNPQSLLTRFYGLYRIQLSKGERIYFSIMQSVFADAPPGMVDNISHTFDLKGSTLGRRAKLTDTVKKDLDILDQERKLKISPEVKHELLPQLKRDVTLLARLGIMDYSFLLGVHERAVDGEEVLQMASPSQSLLHDHRKRFTPSPPPKAADDEDAMSVKSDNFSIQSPHPYHEDEFIDWEQFEWLRPPCTDDCSVASSFEFFSDTAPVDPSAVSSSLSFSSSRMPSSMMLLSKKHICPFLASRIDGGIVSQDGQEVYFAGVIDILQPYNVRKWSETVFKQLQGNPHLTISCVDPETYADRFIKFMSGLLEVEETETETEATTTTTNNNCNNDNDNDNDRDKDEQEN